MKNPVANMSKTCTCSSGLTPRKPKTFLFTI